MKGYGWCFRKGNVLNVGLGRADSCGLPGHVAGFPGYLKDKGRISFEVPALRGHAYLLSGTSRRRMVDNACLLIGDAAGLAYTQSSEGILPAIESILAARSRNSKLELEGYGRVIASRRKSWSAVIAKHIPARLTRSVGRWVLGTPWLTREVVLKSWFLPMA
jgi:flavin-dependent dehydrogenase